MNKKHWNTVAPTGRIHEKVLFHLINHSYELVVSKLSKKQKEALKIF